MILLTIIPAGRWPRRAKPVPPKYVVKNIVLKIYFNDTFNNNSLRPMAAPGEARLKSLLLKYSVKNIF